MANRTRSPKWRAFALAAGVSLSAGEAALAVGLPPAPDLPPATAASEEFSGWYLRGDLGAGFETAPDPGSRTGGVTPSLALPLLSPFAVSAFHGATPAASGTIDAGAGYVFNPWFRMDATLEYRFGGRLRSLYAIDEPSRLAAYGRVRAGVSSLVALVNGYVDLGNYWGATPFVGAGVGVADNALSGVSDAGLAFSGTGAAVPAGGLFSNASRTHFAWALTAGLDFDVAPNLKLELSWRYLDLGAVALGGASARSRGALASNDVRIGLVWLLDAPQAAPAPVVARYGATDR